MSFSRIKYDNEAYDLKTSRSAGPGDYRLFMGFNESCEKCLAYDGPRNSKSDVSIASNDTSNQWPTMTDVESSLTNRVNKLIDFNDYGKNDEYKKLAIENKSSCKAKLVTEDTRFTNPIEAYRGMDLTDYHYTPFLFVNSQCEIKEDRIGLNSRLKVKDTFRVSKPNLIDQSVFLPKETAPNTDICKNN